jgi:uncharacterized membrane protein YhiD involved in acid resistance
MTGQSRRGRARLAVCAFALVLCSASGRAQGIPAQATTGVADPQASERESIVHILLRLPLAAALGTALAMRPRRAGTPPRRPAVVQTQVILSVVGALVMIVVGASLARAFGVVGIAGLIRYRAKIQDPKDAGVMLAALGVGLASGVGLYWLAPIATLFLLGLLWVLESNEPDAAARFMLKVSAPDVRSLRRQVEAVLRRQRLTYELRSWASGELHYAVDVPLDHRTDTVSKALLDLGGGDLAVGWEEAREK